ncbi:putative transmembrane protein [Senna tora]|uniref:Putative transmembrane protein n=1 Tax=Senna tora TaxID=362788 RepID=A0A834WJR9_9FABA|nr:putative transmembrane protein [Senna tora]
MGYLLSVLQFSSKDDDKVGIFDEFQAYLDVFQAPMFQSPEETCSDHEVGPMEEDDGGDGKVSHESNTKVEEEDMLCRKEDTKPNKAEESDQEEKMSLRNSSIGSKKVVSDCNNNNNNTKIDDDGEIKHCSSSSSSGSYGSSMRRKGNNKEWRRTLACKLYEERLESVIIGSEAMDLLWETYDDDDDHTQPPRINNTNGEEEEEDDDDEEKGMNGKYCCLNALKLSTRKMNLGMRRPNLVKISKALKGIGLLQHFSR